MKGFKCLLLAGLSIFISVSPSYAAKGNSLKKIIQAATRQTGDPLVTQKILEANLASKIAFQTWPAGNLLQFSAPTKYLPSVKKMQSLKKVPPFPLQENPREMYRGMTLDAEGKALRQILKNGLEVSKSHYENFDAYDGKEYPEGTKAIYASTNPKHALWYILAEEPGQSPYLPVILHLKRVGKGETVSVPHDIPPSWIYRVSALLEEEGALTWGELKLDPNGNFIFIPYL